LRPLMLVTDIGFIVYWVITAAHVIPPQYLFKDYDNPILSAWNWSFLPLDLLVSATGLGGILLFRKGDSRWRVLTIVSLTLTSCSGLQAIAFWAIRRDFDPAWWLPNLFLLLYPLVYLPSLMRNSVK
ncbi:MAG TPA: DUF5360 family protein, partial [Candidatus Hydrogenedentes bacterium]|nr:DUF5360 family protein [Candidatus Hydrogenedentota bacterium]